VIPLPKSRAHLGAGLALLFVLSAGLIVAILPVEQPLTYLLAGTFAAALTLIAAFLLFITGRL
jgi:hypothetical protein